MKIITAKMLIDKRACEEDIEVFERHWPDGCDFTLRNCQIAFEELGLSVNWAAANLLSQQASDEYKKLSEDMYKACAKRSLVDTVECRCSEDLIEMFYQMASLEGEA